MIEFGDIFDKTGETRIKDTLPPELASLPQQFQENSETAGKTFSIEDVLQPILDLCTGSSHGDSCQRILGVPSLISSLLPYGVPSPSNSYSPIITTDEYAEAAVTSDANNISRRSIKVDTSVPELYKALNIPFLSPPSFSVNDYLSRLCHSYSYRPTYDKFCSDFIGDITDALIFNLRYIQLKSSFDDLQSQYPAVKLRAIQLDRKLQKEDEWPNWNEKSDCSELLRKYNDIYVTDSDYLPCEYSASLESFCNTIIPKDMIHASFCK